MTQMMQTKCQYLGTSYAERACTPFRLTKRQSKKQANIQGTFGILTEKIDHGTMKLYYIYITLN